MKLLQSLIQQQTTATIIDLEGLLRTVLCPGHWPEPSDYRGDILRNRFESRVMVELWGMIELKRTIFYYAVIPLAQMGEEAFYTSGYVADPVDNLIALFADPVELKAYALLALGAFELRQLDQLAIPSATHYHRAIGILCRAATMTDRAAKREDPLGLSPTAKQWQVLRDIAQQGVHKVLTRAFADPSYIGPFKPEGTEAPPVPEATCAVPNPVAPIPFTAAELR